MEIIPLSYPIGQPSAACRKGKQVMAIGDFDGVHLGHQEVIGRALKTAEQLHLPASIMTFHPHPRAVMGQDKYTELLTPLNKKMEIFEKLGVAHTYVVTFDDSLMRLTPEQFVDDVLQGLGVESVICGFDFRFGYQGKGTPDTLCELSHGKFAVEVIRPYHLHGEKVSSTNIRNALQRGDLEEVTTLLGRHYSIRGEVVGGDRRGRTIGFPTANILPEEAYVLPIHGVYAVKALVKGVCYKGVMNIGVKPTFATGVLKPTLEVHLFDFHDDIYGERVTVELVSFLRAERKFTSVDELISQIRQDAEQSKAKLMTIS